MGKGQNEEKKERSKRERERERERVNKTGRERKDGLEWLERKESEREVYFET